MGPGSLMWGILDLEDADLNMGDSSIDGTTRMSPRFPIRRTRVVSRVSEILRICAGKKVLHLGCADMPYVLRGKDLLHNHLAEVTDKDMLWGLDISEEGVRKLRDQGFENIILGDVEKMGSEFREMNFDVVVVGEILEHIANAGLFLHSLGSIMTENTELIVTTPNANSFKGFVHSMLRREKVNPDHNYYFSFRTIKQLLEKFDLRCDEVYYYQDIEGTGLTKVVDRVMSLAPRVSPVWADGIFARVTLKRSMAREPSAGAVG